MFCLAVFLAVVIQTGAFQFEGEEIKNYQMKDAESMMLKLEFSADRRVPRNKWTTSCSMAAEVEPLQPIQTLWTKCIPEFLVVAEMDMKFLMNTKMDPEIQMIHRSQIIYFSIEEIVHVSRDYFRYSNDSFSGDGKVPTEFLDVSEKPMWEFKHLVREDGKSDSLQLHHPTFRGLMLEYPGSEESWFSLLANMRQEKPKITNSGGIDVQSGWRINEVRWTAKPNEFFYNINHILEQLVGHAEAEFEGCKCIQIGLEEEKIKNQGDELREFCRKVLRAKKEAWSFYLPFARLSDCVEIWKKPKANNIKKVTLEEGIFGLKDEL